MKTLESKGGTPVTLFLMLILANTANAADLDLENPEISIIMVGLIAMALAIYSYKLHTENTRLKNEMKLLKLKFKGYFYSMNDKQKPTTTEKTREEKTGERSDKGIGSFKERYARKLYWDRLLSTMDKSSRGKTNLEVLEGKKRDMEEVIRLTKKKYHQREIDEQGFNELIKEQQKQMIEIEAKISKLRKENEGKDGEMPDGD